jgi:hypothetical protein
METIKLQNWYQIDFKITTTPKALLLLIASMISLLKKKDLITEWFYLYENTTIRIRFNSREHKLLEKEVESFVKENNISLEPTKPFEEYCEDKAIFPNNEMLDAFVTIMHQVSELTIGRLQGKNTFSNYTLTERLSHCIYNNVYGINAEPYFMLKRLGFSVQNDDLEDDPELTILDEKIEVVKIESASINAPMNIPVKRK